MTAERVPLEHEAYRTLAVVTRPSDSMVNGYRMRYSWKVSEDQYQDRADALDCERPALDWSCFLKFLEAWCRPASSATRPETRQELRQSMCDRWSYVDAHGQENVGFWQAAEGSFQRTHAGTLMREQNVKALCALPYPKSAILYAVGLTCSLNFHSERFENVRFCNFLCEWVRRKTVRLFEWEAQRVRAVVDGAKPIGIGGLDAIVAEYGCSDWYMEYRRFISLFDCNTSEVDVSNLSWLFLT